VRPKYFELLTVSTRESVANPGFRENQFGLLGILFQLLPQTSCVSVDCSGESIRVIAPNRTEKFVSRHRGARPLHQVAKKLEFAGCEIDRLSVS